MRRLISIFVFAVMLNSCTKVVNINLNDASPKIVIEGNVTNTAGPYQVKITKTVNFSASNIFPAVSGAVVTITDNTNSIANTLSESSPGIYISSTLQGVAGHTYSLSVSSEGSTYTSSSTMPLPVSFDSISFSHIARFGGTDINAVANFQDPPGLGNYYSFTETVNGQQSDRVQSYEDRLSDGRYIQRELSIDTLKAGNVVVVSMNCIDKGTYNYISTLRQVTGGNNFNSLSPANPVSNISNGALGYFSAHTVQIRTAIVH